MGLAPLMTDLFPLPLIKFCELDSETKSDVLIAIGTPSMHEGTIIRPAQATMPMRFTWVVSLAHKATTNIIKTAYQITKTMRTLSQNETTLVFFNCRSAPFKLTTGTALALEIIDDISILYAGWTNVHIIAFHKELVKLLTKAGLPIA